MARPFLHLAPISCSAEGFFFFFYKPLYVCEVGGYWWEAQLPGTTMISGWVGKRDKRKPHQRDCNAFYYSASFLPTIKPLINSPVHGEITQRPSWLQRRQLSTSKWGKCQSVHLPFFSFSISLLQIFSWGPADTDARWDANHYSFNSLYFTGSIRFVLCFIILKIISYSWTPVHTSMYIVFSYRVLNSVCRSNRDHLRTWNVPSVQPPSVQTSRFKSEVWSMLLAPHL